MLKNMCDVTQLGRGRTGMDALETGVRAGRPQTRHGGDNLQVYGFHLCAFLRR